MQATDTLKAEHNGVLVVVAQLERAAPAAARGARVPKDVFEDIREFFAIFVDRCHHGKEEAMVFPKLLGRPEQADLVRQLESEHEVGRALAAAYANAVRTYMPGDREIGRQLAAAAQEYGAFLRQHIDLENSNLLPVMDRELADRDAALTEAFERHEIEQIGEGTHERLHGMIDSLGPRIDPWLAQV